MLDRENHSGLMTIANVIDQLSMCFNGPTEILSYQHYKLQIKFLEIRLDRILSGRTEYKKRKEIIKNLEKGKIDLIIGTHALFQKK